MNETISIKAVAEIRREPVNFKLVFIDDGNEELFLTAINSICNRLMRRLDIGFEEVLGKFTLFKNDVKIDWPKFDYKRVTFYEDYETDESGLYLKYPAVLKEENRTKPYYSNQK